MVRTPMQTMKVNMMLKCEIVDKQEIRSKLDVIKQEPKQQVQAYYDKMQKLFTRGKLEDVEQKRSFIF